MKKNKNKSLSFRKKAEKAIRECLNDYNHGSIMTFLAVHHEMPYAYIAYGDYEDKEIFYMKALSIKPVKSENMLEGLLKRVNDIIFTYSDLACKMEERRRAVRNATEEEREESVIKLEDEYDSEVYTNESLREGFYNENVSMFNEKDILNVIIVDGYVVMSGRLEIILIQ